MFNVKKNKKGFTLVELMVVVVIIGILTAIAIPVYNSVTANAKEKTCLANQRTIDSSIEVAMADGCTYKKTGAVTANKEFSSIADLVTLGYLAEAPKDPFTGGAYFIGTDSKTSAILCGYTAGTGAPSTATLHPDVKAAA
jgi:prepilin-type N-terminal cleavage/methylation domain